MVAEKAERKFVKGFPYPYFWTVVALLLLVGVGDMIYLSISHYRVYTDMGYQSFCAISRAINCDTVSQSRYSIFMGIPVPIWGIMGYVPLIVLFGLSPVWRLRNDDSVHLWSLFFVIALAYTTYSFYLGYVSSARIRAYCIMCMLGWAVNFLLFFHAYLIRRRFEGVSLIQGAARGMAFLYVKRKITVPLLVAMVTGFGLIAFMLPEYWKFKPPAYSTKLSKGKDSTGVPWIGAGDPELEIVEYTDYMCFQCSKIHFFLRRLVEQYPDKIRLVHRHFPMDHKFNPVVEDPYHSGAGALALLAIHAAKQDKFWEVNDILFNMARQTGEINVRQVAAEADLDPDQMARAVYNPDYHWHLKHDILTGIQNGIYGTPSFLINGRVYEGQIPPEVFNGIIR